MLFSGGRPTGACGVENYAVATLRTAAGTAIRLGCSWRLPAGRDAIIEAQFYGTRGGAAFRNVNGSFYDFLAERYRGTATEPLAVPPDEWGGRAALAWAARLGRDAQFDSTADEIVQVAEVVDRLYREAGVEPASENTESRDRKRRS